MAFIAAFDIGADPAIPEQFHWCLENRRDQFSRSQSPLRDPKGFAGLLTECQTLGTARIDFCTLRQASTIEIIPAGTTGVEQPLALHECGRRIRIRVDKNVQVVKRCHQPNLFRQQHAIAEDIASHVANTGHSKGLLLDVLALFTEVPLHTFPGAAGGDAHLLVVVACRAARGKGITQPKTVFVRQTVSDIRESRGPLVGSHDQIGVVLVVAHHPRGRHDRLPFPVIGDIQQATDELLVAGDPLFLPGITVRRVPLLDHETALGTHRHNDGILDHLGFDQAQHFSAKILATI